MKVAVFGASGRVGEALVPVLLEAGHDVRAMQHKTPVDLPGVEVVPGSLSDPAAVAQTIGDAEIVLHMTKGTGGEGIDQAVEISVRGTLNILDAVHRCPAVTQYLLTSSDAAAGIWFHPHDGPISHATEPMSYPGYYSLGKVLEEVIVAEYHRNTPLPYTVARLSYVHQEDSVLKLFIAGLDLAKPGRGPFDDRYTDRQKKRLDKGERFVVLPCDEAGAPLGRTLVQRQDVVDALLAMLGHSAAIGRRFHVSGPGFTYDRPCEHLSEKLGLPVERVTVPDAHSFDIDVSTEKALLGWQPKFDVVAMLDAALAYRPLV